MAQLSVSSLKGKRITVGITGGIAAYKAADIVSWLHRNEAEVQVAMTAAACRFITPLTMKTLSGRPVLTDIMDESGCWNVPHIDLAACDLFLLLPATANIMAKAAHGIADELISASLLATEASVLCAPAMNDKMYANPATQANLRILKERGWGMIEPECGRLACGTEGKGRLADLDSIKTAILEQFAEEELLRGKTVLVSAGPTYEYLDPVRFFGNRSSGKMGYAAAKAAKAAGAEVVLVSGPVDLEPPAGVRTVHAVSAQQMQQAIMNEYPACDIVIMAAAVADFRPETVSEQKLKKNGQATELRLVPNPDILAGLGREKGNRFLCGFAAETQNVAEYARKKLREKNLDLIIANDVSREGAGFDVDTNIITAYYGEKEKAFPMMSKYSAARAIIELIAELLSHKE